MSALSKHREALAEGQEERIKALEAETDGLLREKAEFEKWAALGSPSARSIVGAVKYVIALQQLFSEYNADMPGDRRMGWRIGIDSGEGLVDGDDILRRRRHHRRALSKARWFFVIARNSTFGATSAAAEALGAALRARIRKNWAVAGEPGERYLEEPAQGRGARDVGP